MVFNVDYDKVNSVGLNLEKESQDLAKNFEDLLKIIEEFEKSWDGIDYQNFKSKSSEYILKINPMIENLDYISKFMQKAANKYSNNDTGWLESVKKIGVEENDEQRNEVSE